MSIESGVILTQCFYDKNSQSAYRNTQGEKGQIACEKSLGQIYIDRILKNVVYNPSYGDVSKSSLKKIWHNHANSSC